MTNKWLEEIYGQQKMAADSTLTPEDVDQMSPEEVDTLYNQLFGDTQPEQVGELDKQALDNLEAMFTHLGKVAARAHHEQLKIMKIAEEIGADPDALDEAITLKAVELLQELGFQFEGMEDETTEE